MATLALPKTELARQLGISRAALYYQPTKPREDAMLRDRILAVQRQHRAYGHRRIALALRLNKKRIRRVMRAYGLRPRVARRQPVKPADRGQPPSTVPNLAKTLCPIHPNVLWVGDFTYLPLPDGFLYLATVMDVFLRAVVGWHLSTHHTTALIASAFLDAVQRAGATPRIFHSDQGSEYVSGRYALLLARHGVTPSHSQKSSPWENGFQESFYNNFKLELGNPARFPDLGQLIEAVHRQLHYYNHNRIHTVLKMPPMRYHDLWIRTFAQQKTAVMAS